MIKLRRHTSMCTSVEEENASCRKAAEQIEPGAVTVVIGRRRPTASGSDCLGDDGWHLRSTVADDEVRGGQQQRDRAGDSAATGEERGGECGAAGVRDDAGCGPGQHASKSEDEQP